MPGKNFDAGRIFAGAYEGRLSGKTDRSETCGRIKIEKAQGRIFVHKTMCVRMCLDAFFDLCNVKPKISALENFVKDWIDRIISEQNEKTDNRKEQFSKGENS